MSTVLKHSWDSRQLPVLAALAVMSFGCGTGVPQTSSSTGSASDTVGSQPRVEAISGSEIHSLALLEDGSVLAWGDGDARAPTSSPAPTPSSGLSDIVAIAAGGEKNVDVTMRLSGPFGGSSNQSSPPPTVLTTGFGLALKKDGTVWACGNNGLGELGSGTNSDAKDWAQINGLADIKFITAGGNFALAVAKDGSVWAWGANDEGQLGDGTDIQAEPGAGSLSNGKEAVHHVRKKPAQIKGFGGVKSVAVAGLYGSYALKGDGTVWGWGWNANGELGIGAASGDVLKPKKLPGIVSAIAIAAGESHGIALDNYGAVWAWGRPGAGLGSERKLPLNMRLVNGDMVQRERYTQQMGEGVGQLGNGSDDASPKPIKVPGLKDVVAIAASGDASFALRNDGTVWAWGENRQGQLGNGTYGAASSPVQAKNLRGVTKIAVGASCCFAWTKDGAIWAWGDNTQHQFGDSSTTSSNVPVKLARLSR